MLNGLIIPHEGGQDKKRRRFCAASACQKSETGRQRAPGNRVKGEAVSPAFDVRSIMLETFERSCKNPQPVEEVLFGLLRQAEAARLLRLSGRSPWLSAQGNQFLHIGQNGRIRYPEHQPAAAGQDGSLPIDILDIGGELGK